MAAAAAATSAYLHIHHHDAASSLSSSLGIHHRSSSLSLISSRTTSPLIQFSPKCINVSKPLFPIRKLTGNTLINSSGHFWDGHTCVISGDRKSHLFFKKSSKTRPQYFSGRGYGTNYAVSVGRTNHELSFHNDGKEPFWLAPTKGVIRGLKSVFAFLMEQPSQLKYIEWPGFQNTLKTATLTLVLVAMLVVVLSSVESGLWYLLTLILRKPA